MAETLGMLCDKLTIIKLKQYHCEDSNRLGSLNSQEKLLQQEIDDFIFNAISGNIPKEKLSFASNKIFKKDGNDISVITGSLGSVLSSLADINCKLWHEQEKVYEFEKVAADEKDSVIKRLAILNLERNSAIDEIDRQFIETIKLKQ